MKTEEQLKARSGTSCELCSITSGLHVYEVAPVASNITGNEALFCAKCIAQIDKKEELDPAHWECLKSAMWSEFPAVQVTAWRMLNRLRSESWAAECIDMMYFDDETMEWAKATGDHENDASVDLHRDSNGHVLEHGDTVVLTKSLDVKGSTVNARLGTVVRNIKLDPNDTGYIEGRIEGQSIMIKTIYVRKQGAGV
ncbi:PhnA domain-containing protein [Rurimicrobium arvi]|uniref:Alkylphosphonate utilization protein n=1 Tax=Rurimicrobium arvi TaxID=2049916 RepID=A0ABP8MMQ9_9BACT